MADRSETIFTGTIVESLPNTTFRVLLEDGRETIAYIAGKMRIYRIKVLIGDKVKVQMSPYGDNKCRIIQRM